MWGPARTQLLTDSFFFFFTKLVFRLSPGLEAELSASGHESVQPLIAQGHKTTPIVMCRHRRQGLGRGARPGLRGSTFLMPRYNPFLCSLFSLSCYIWAVSPPSLVAVHHFLFPSLLFFWFPFFFFFPLSTCDLFNLYHFYLSDHFISQLTEHLLYARHCSQHCREDENGAERSHTSKMDMVRSRRWERLPSRKQRGRHAISGGERCQKEDKLDKCDRKWW